MRLIIYLDDILLMAKSVENIKIARYTTLYLLHHLGFIVNVNKPILEPCQSIKCLGMIVNSKSMTMQLPQTKVFDPMDLCQYILTRDLSATAPAITPAPLQIRYLQQCQIKSQQASPSYETQVNLDETAIVDREFKPGGGKTTFTAITRDGNSVGCCSHRRAGSCNGGFLYGGGGMWTKKGKFTPHQHSSIINSPTAGQHCSTTLPLENGGTKSKTLTKISKEI